MRLKQGTIVVLGAATLLLGCGKPATPQAQIRANFARLIAAFGQLDGHAMCELLFPFGEHQPASALATTLKTLNTASGRSSYQRYVDRCAADVARVPQDYAGYKRAFRGVSLGSITVHGSIATVHAGAPGHKRFQLRFVDAAGEWRLLEGVQ